MRECYVVGCGRSLLDLSADEIAHVNRAELVLVFNKFVMFHEKVGIRPTHFYLGDVNPKADIYLEETLRRVTEGVLPNLQLILSRTYQLPLLARMRHFGWVLWRCVRNAALRRWPARFRHHAALVRLSRRLRNLDGVRYVERCPWLEEDAWAETLDEPVLHYRGSLSDCINLACILAPGAVIKLLGVDLTDHVYFFQEELEADPERWALLLKRGTPDAKEHETLIGIRGSGGIQDRIPYMREQVRRRGGELVCCNSRSYLVEHGLVPYVGVTELVTPSST